MSDETPTQRLPETPGDAGELVEERKKSKALLFTLIGVGAALLIAIVVLLIMLFSGGGPGGPSPTPSGSATPSTSPTPSDSPTPSATPTPTPTATADPPPPPPPPSGPDFTVFAPDTTVSCSAGGPGFPPTVPLIEVRWETRAASEVWFVMGTDDAVDSGYMQVPTAGDEGDFPYEIQFPCNQESQKFTLTLLADNGQHVSKTWTVANDGDVF